MSTERPTLAERFDAAGILPHQREAAGVSIVLCELVDELVMAVLRQNTLLARVAVEQRADTRAGQTRGAGDNAGAAAPSGTAEGEDQGGAQVQLREPGLPPEDPDAEPAKPAASGTDGTVAEPTDPPGATGRRPAGKAAAAKKAAPAKTPTATREGRRQ